MVEYNEGDWTLPVTCWHLCCCLSIIAHIFLLLVGIYFKYIYFLIIYFHLLILYVINFVLLPNKVSPSISGLIQLRPYPL